MSSNINFDIFVSYSLDNKKEVLELCNSLKNGGLKLWIDEEQIVHEKVNEIKQKGIKESKFFMCCATTAYCKSDAIKELNYAKSMKKNITYVTFEKFKSEIDMLTELKKILFRVAKQTYFKNDNIDRILESFNKLNKVNKNLNKFITAFKKN
jgi:hypothetical protein